MRWKKGRRSRNVEDRRGRSGRMPLPMRVGGRGGKMGIGTLVVVVVVMYFLGVDPSVLLQGSGQMSTQVPSGESAPRPAEEDRLAEFVAVVLADTEDTWHALFPDELGRPYVEPSLVLFTGTTQSACGFAQSAMGPFYCPSDQKVYIDLAFYDELRRRFGAPGDFAQAYVIAHEVGHHIQTLLGTSRKVHAARSRLGEAEGNRLSVKLELQADCYAGVWAHHAHRARNILEAGDVEEALGAAAAIGDDRLQRQTSGRVAPDSFTHGSSAQRVRWFRRGLEGGDLEACDTFSVAAL